MCVFSTSNEVVDFIWTNPEVVDFVALSLKVHSVSKKHNVSSVFATISTFNSHPHTSLNTTSAIWTL